MGKLSESMAILETEEVTADEAQINGICAKSQDEGWLSFGSPSEPHIKRGTHDKNTYVRCE